MIIGSDKMINDYNIQSIPARQTIHSAGYDLEAIEDMIIEPWGKTFDTCIRFDGEEVPVIQYEGYGSDQVLEFYPKEWVALIVPRSSYGFKHGLQMCNTICVIDQDYRDTIKVRMRADHSFKISKGERFAQMIFIPHCVLLDEIPPTKERTGGIGSTTLEDFYGKD